MGTANLPHVRGIDRATAVSRSPQEPLPLTPDVLPQAGVPGGASKNVDRKVERQLIRNARFPRAMQGDNRLHEEAAQLMSILALHAIPHVIDNFLSHHRFHPFEWWSIVRAPGSETVVHCRHCSVLEIWYLHRATEHPEPAPSLYRILRTFCVIVCWIV